MNDTICAPATAAGVGAIGIIRVSGRESFAAANHIFKGKNILEAPSHTVHYGYIEDTETSEIIDEVMISVFRAPKTFTGEDSVEISHHGSPVIAKRILEILQNHGVRPAKPGEFTMRAFLNGRIDLAQAESVADLISAENEASRKVALAQLKGGISGEIAVLRGDLLNFASLIELELDFAEEDVEFADRTALQNLVQSIKYKVQSLLGSFKYGNAIKNGIPVALAGKPNAGKSTLLNALLKEERAIVSEIAGTTRDTIEEILHIDGTAFRLTDTAGLRETGDLIEKIGVEKAREKVAKADILVYLIDSGEENISEDLQKISEFERDSLHLVILQTKCDSTTHPHGPANADIIQHYISQNRSKFKQCRLLPVSAKTGWNMSALLSEFSGYAMGLKTAENTVVITNQRHYQALQKSLESIQNVEDAISGKISTELLAYELRAALEHLGEISGEFTNDEVLGNIFGKFCIGK